MTQGVGNVWDKETSPAKYPNFNAWHERLKARPSVKKILEL